MKKINVLTLFSIFLLITLPQSALAVGIQIYNVSSEQALINSWINNLGGTVNVVEDFEGIESNWYQTLGTNVGTFRLNDSTMPGTGTTSYKSQVDPTSSEAFFQVRGFDANGRFNTTPDDGKRYLDSADITSFTLDVVPDTFTNLFFFMTDPSDVKARTSTSSNDITASIDYRKSNGSLWFIGIDLGTDYISQITWDVTYNEAGYTNDGFGLDGFSTVAVPEPLTLFLIGSGLAGLGLYRRRSLKR